MKVTFLGHQGWAIDAGEGVIAIDLLRQGMGNGTTILPVWPPRTIDLERLPSLAAIVITHEHGDHFDIRTLAELPRSVPVVIPDRASEAMKGALEDLGFSIHLLRPFTAYHVGGVAITALPTAPSMLERDVYGLLLEDNAARRFLTFVDGAPAEEAVDWLERYAPERTLDNFTNNSIRLLPELSDVAMPQCAIASMAMRALLDFVDEFTPKRVVISGLGWSYADQHAHLNQAVFAVDNTQLARAAQELFPSIEWSCPAPGDTFLLNKREIAALKRPEWVRLDGPPVPRAGTATYGDRPFPFCGTVSLDSERLAMIRNFVLEKFGRALCGASPELDRGLGRLATQPDAPYSRSLLLRVLNGDGWRDFELDHARRRFVPAEIDGNPVQAYVAGVEIWASDLALLLDAEEEAHLVYEASVRTWNHNTDLLPQHLPSHFFAWFHPHFRPLDFLAAYRRMHRLPRRKVAAAE